MKPLMQLLLVFATLGYSYASILAAAVDPSCFVVKSDECPNRNVTFWLYSNTTRDAPVLLNPLDLNPWDFQPPRPLKILLHGYTGYRDFSPNDHIRPVLLDNEDVYVISIDYAPLVRSPCYFHAVQNLPMVAKCLAQLINELVRRGIVQHDLIHIIGFSLGGQVAGQTANYLKSKLKRITGLDPAKPLFILGSDKRRLDAGDAEFVDVIHTDTLGRGMLRPMGHVDFYPNFGPLQPGCFEESPNDPGSCNHDRAPRFYAASINSTLGFWGRQCSSWLIYLFGLCSTRAPEALMGYHVTKGLTGVYFLKTESKAPYALGKQNEADNSKYVAKFHLDSRLSEIEDDYEPQWGERIPDLESNELEANELERQLVYKDQEKLDEPLA